MPNLYDTLLVRSLAAKDAATQRLVEQEAAQREAAVSQYSQIAKTMADMESRKQLQERSLQSAEERASAANEARRMLEDERVRNRVEFEGMKAALYGGEYRTLQDPIGRTVVQQMLQPGETLGAATARVLSTPEYKEAYATKAQRLEAEKLQRAKAAGGGQGLAPRTIGDLQTDIVKAQDVLLSLEEIAALPNAEKYMAYYEKGKQFTGDIASRLGVAGPALNQSLAEGQTAYGAVNRLMLAYRKSITGVAGGEKELDFIENAYLSRLRSPATFRPTLQQIHRETEIASKLKSAMLRGDVDISDPTQLARFRSQFRNAAGGLWAAVPEEGGSTPQVEPIRRTHPLTGEVRVWSETEQRFVPEEEYAQ